MICNEVIVLAGSAIGSVLSLLEQIKNDKECITYVVCLNSNSHTIFKKSNYVNNVTNLHFSNNSEFYSEFKNWFYHIDFKFKPVVYFTTDSSCYRVNQFRKWFESNCILCLPSSQIINTYTKKGVAELAAKENGLLIPKTTILQKSEDLEQVVNTFEFPVILKPRSTYESKKSPFKVKVFNKDTFYDQTKNLMEKGHILVCQEYISGNDDSVSFYIFNRSEDGKINYVAGRKVLQNPPGAGLMAKGIIEENLELNSQCENFLEKIGYKGIGGLEFKKFKEKFYFIEMNTRVEGIFKITSIANVRIGLIAYNNLIGSEEKNSVVKQKNGGIYFDLLMMITAHRKNKALFSIFFDIWKLIFNTRYHLNIYSKNDKKPFYSILIQSFK